MKERNRPHLVQRFKYDVKIERREDATRIQNELSRLFNFELKRILDKVLTELDRPGYISRFESLEIDLGDIPEHYLDSELPHRFEQKLRRELELLMGELRLADKSLSAAKGEQIAAAPAKLEIMGFFLLNGYLPTGAESYAGGMEALLIDLAKEDPQGLSRILRETSAQSKDVVKRLSHQFSDKALEVVYQVTAPHNNLLVFAYEKELMRDAGNVLNMPVAKIRQAVRMAILGHLLLQRTPVFDSAKFRRDVRRNFIAEIGEEAREVFQGKGGGDADDEVAVEKQEAKKSEESFKVIMALLRGEGASMAPSKVAEAWDFLLLRSPEAFRAMLERELGRKAHSLMDLMRFVPTVAIRRLISILVPASSARALELVAAVISAHGMLARGSDKDRQVVQRVYAVLLAQVVKAKSNTIDLEELSEVLRKELVDKEQLPESLAEQWDELELPGTKAAERAAEKRRQKAKEAQKKREEKEAEEARLREEQEEKELQQRLKDAVAEQKKEIEALLKAREEEKKRKAEEAAKKAEEEALEEKIWDYRDAEEAVEFMDPPSERDLVFFSLESVEGRTDLILQYIQTGRAPWWAPGITTTEVAAFFKSLLDESPAHFAIRLKAMLAHTSRSRYTQIVTRLVSDFSEQVLADFVFVLLPEVGGFFETLSLALEKFYEEKARSWQLPAELKEPFQFARYHATRYVLEYLSSSPSPSQMLRFVLREIGRATGQTPRSLIADVMGVAEAFIAKGEKRFIPLKSMLPKPFEGLELPPPEAHGPAEEQISAKLAEAQELTEEEVLLMELQMVAEAALQVEEVPEGLEESKEKVRELKEQQEAIREKAKEVEALLAQLQKAEAGELAKLKDLQELRQELELELAGLENAEAAPELKQRLAALAKEIEALLARLKETVTEKEAEAKKLAELKAEVNALQEKVDEEPAGKDKQFEVELKAMRQYFEFGSLPIETARLFTEASFSAMLRQRFQEGRPALKTMLREVLSKQGARIRLLKHGQELVLLALPLISEAIGSKMVPIVRDMIQLFSTSSPIVLPQLVMEHAIRYAHKFEGPGFLPIKYIKEFLVYAAKATKEKKEDILHFMSSRIGDIDTELGVTIREVLEAIAHNEAEKKRRARSKEEKEPPKKPTETPKKKTPEIFYVSNAGLPIVGTFLPQLFNMHGYLNEDRTEFKSRVLQSRAVMLLQYLLTLDEDPPEEILIFNKLVMGLPLDEPLEPMEEPLTAEEKESINSLMDAIKQRWTVMERSSIEYIRQTFFIRDGSLQKAGEDWQLKVEKKGFDVLLNKIPWGISPIKLPWLTFMVQVDW